MAKDIGMTIRKGTAVSFLPCLVAFWGFHPYMFFYKYFFVIYTEMLVTFCPVVPWGNSTCSKHMFKMASLVITWMLSLNMWRMKNPRVLPRKAYYSSLFRLVEFIVYSL